MVPEKWIKTGQNLLELGQFNENDYNLKWDNNEIG